MNPDPLPLISDAAWRVIRRSRPGLRIAGVAPETRSELLKLAYAKVDPLDPALIVITKRGAVAGRVVQTYGS